LRKSRVRQTITVGFAVTEPIGRPGGFPSHLAQEIVMMKPLGLISLAAAMLAFLAVPSSAQNSASPRMIEKPVALPQTGGTGTAPGSMGSTGWTGGQTDPGKPDPESASQQPFMATGEDLNGPPKQFPAQQTPE
jgi:hypothetical protein